MVIVVMGDHDDVDPWQFAQRNGLSDSSQRLVASPALLARFPDVLAPADLALLPTADWGPAGREHVWRLRGPDGAAATVQHRPRLITDDPVAMRAAAVNGVAVAQLPTLLIQDDLLHSLLVEVLPQWLPRSGIIHAAQRHHSCGIPLAARVVVGSTRASRFPRRRI